MFSVIIPLYNKEKYIHKAIESVLNQSYTDFELIIVDDGSTDSGLLIVQKKTDKRIRIIRQNNAGVSNARNNGAKNAKFELIAFLDADDWWDPQFLEEMLNLHHKNPTAAIYSSAYFKVKNTKLSQSKNNLNTNYQGVINYFKVYSSFWWMPITCSNTIIKKSIFNEFGGFNEQLKFGEDQFLWLNVALKYQVYYSNKPLAFYNQDVDTTNRAVGAKKKWKKEEHFLFSLKQFDLIENQDLKYLLEGIKLRASVNFYIQKHYLEEIKAIIEDIDLTKHDKKASFYFRFPRFYVTSYVKLKSIGSQIKKKLKK